MASNGDSYRAAIDRFNAGDLDGYLAFYSDDVVFGGVSPEPMDKAGVGRSTRASRPASPGPGSRSRIWWRAGTGWRRG